MNGHNWQVISEISEKEIDFMEELTELQYPFNELYQHVQDIHDNAEFLKEGLNGYLNAGKSKKLKHEKLVKMQRAIGELMSLANGLECRFNAIEWPDYKHPLPDSSKDEIVFLTDFQRPVVCGERANRDLTDKEML